MTFISVYVSGYANTGHSKYINKLSDKTIFCNLNIVTLSGLDVGIIRSLIKLGDLNNLYLKNIYMKYFLREKLRFINTYSYIFNICLF